MAMRRVVVAEYGEMPQDLPAGRVARNQDHRLLPVPVRGGIALPHEDEDRAARVAPARGPPLASIDDVVVALAHDGALDVGRIRRGDRGLGHGEARADLAVEGRLQPLPLLRGR